MFFGTRQYCTSFRRNIRIHLFYPVCLTSCPCTSFLLPIPLPSSMMAGRLSFFSLVSQIKLLVNMPETLWNVLEALDHLCAARLCIMARHIMDSVNEMTASGELRNAVVSWCPACLSVRLPACLSVCLFICLCACLFVCVHVCACFLLFFWCLSFFSTPCAPALFVRMLHCVIRVPVTNIQ